jgi:hypothetical protein
VFSLKKIGALIQNKKLIKTGCLLPVASDAYTKLFAAEKFPGSHKNQTQIALISTLPVGIQHR